MYNRRQFLQLTTASLGLSVMASCGRPVDNSSLASLGVGGSPILLTLPLAYLIERSNLRDAIADIEFFPTRNHEQMKALLAS